MDQSRAPSLLEFWRRPRLATGRFAPLRISEWIGWLCLMVVLSFIAEAIGYLMLHLLGHAIPNDRFINHMASHPSWRFAALLLVGGALANRHGARRVYMGGLALFVAASACCGASGWKSEKV